MNNSMASICCSQIGTELGCLADDHFFYLFLFFYFTMVLSVSPTSYSQGKERKGVVERSRKSRAVGREMGLLRRVA